MAHISQIYVYLDVQKVRLIYLLSFFLYDYSGNTQTPLRLY